MTLLGRIASFWRAGQCALNVPLAGVFGLRSAVRDYNSAAVMRPFFTTLILGVIGSVALLAQDAQGPQQRLTPKEIKWPAAAPTLGTSGAAGLQTVVLKGDPKKPGLLRCCCTFHQIRRFWRIPTKMTGLQLCCQVSGISAIGREFDEAALKELPAGSFILNRPVWSTLRRRKNRKRLSKLQATDQPALHTSIQRTTRRKSRCFGRPSSRDDKTVGTGWSDLKRAGLQSFDCVDFERADQAAHGIPADRIVTAAQKRLVSAVAVHQSRGDPDLVAVQCDAVS
jgi:hypothetical protein